MTTAGDGDPLTRELRDDWRIARVRQALNAAIQRACEADQDMTYGDVVDALTGVAHRYAQHFRRTDTMPIALPADRELFPLAVGVGPDGLYDAERTAALEEALRGKLGQPAQVLPPGAVYELAQQHTRPGDLVTITVVMPEPLPAGVDVEVADQHGRPIASGTTGGCAGGIVWKPAAPPAPPWLDTVGPAAMRAHALHVTAAGELVLVIAEASPGAFTAGADVLVSSDGDALVTGTVLGVRPAPDTVTVDPGITSGDVYGQPAGWTPETAAAVVDAWTPKPDAPAAGGTDPDGPIAAGLCGRCGSPDHRTPACDADDFTAAAWLGRDRP